MLLIAPYRAIKGTPRAVDAHAEKPGPTLLRRFAMPDEVANMICYVCSPASSATNGAALRVGGGAVRNIV
ncbi:MAG: hypothetical protein ACR2KU_06600 [Gammaproteobacteria bacterium]